jgi:hypothetical protein
MTQFKAETVKTESKCAGKRLVGFPFLNLHSTVVVIHLKNCIALTDYVAPL